ncbi:MAG: hypothetical protein KC766_03265 [Myxococcales bacterium]|nr:hypothetical protein [Myxococcales bacterium]
MIRDWPRGCVALGLVGVACGGLAEGSDREPGGTDAREGLYVGYERELTLWAWP